MTGVDILWGPFYFVTPVLCSCTSHISDAGTNHFKVLGYIGTHAGEVTQSFSFLLFVSMWSTIKETQCI